MAPARTTASRGTKAVVAAASRYDRRMAEILQYATDVFYEKGYAAASMRDLSRATGMSLAGLYHYFESKEKLLYLIQKNTFETILERLRQRLEEARDPEQRLRIFVQNHLEYFLANQKGMKVLSHEGGVLRNDLGEQIRAIKRQYYVMCRTLVDEFKRQRKTDFVPSRLAVLSLFGMMNWIYTWHNSKVDADAGELARRMGDLFLRGLMGSRARKGETIHAAAARKTVAPRKRSTSSKK